MPRWEAPASLRVSAVDSVEIHSYELNGRTAHAAHVAESMLKVPFNQWMKSPIPMRYILDHTERSYQGNVIQAAQRRGMSVKTAIRGDLLYIMKQETP
jgi:hypothetical protein